MSQGQLCVGPRNLIYIYPESSLAPCRSPPWPLAGFSGSGGGSALLEDLGLGSQGNRKGEPSVRSGWVPFSARRGTWTQSPHRHVQRSPHQGTGGWALDCPFPGCHWQDSEAERIQGAAPKPSASMFCGRVVRKTVTIRSNHCWHDCMFPALC